MSIKHLALDVCSKLMHGLDSVEFVMRRVLVSKKSIFEAAQFFQ